MPYAVALVLTVGVEVPLYVAVLRAGLGWGWRKALLGALVVNLVSHPAAWLLLTDAGPSYLSRFWLVECGVWLVETALLYALARRDLVLIGLTALVANTASALLGVGAWWLGR